MLALGMMALALPMMAARAITTIYACISQRRRSIVVMALAAIMGSARAIMPSANIPPSSRYNHLLRQIYNIAIEAELLIVLACLCYLLHEGSRKIGAAEKNIGRIMVSMDSSIVRLIAIETGLHIRIKHTTDNMLLALENEAVTCPVV